jgi:hypothetical protein
LDICQIELEGSTSEGLSTFLGRARDKVRTIVSKVRSTVSGPVSSGKSGNTASDDDDESKRIKDFDSKFKADKQIPGTKKSFNWAESQSKGYIAGEGDFGFAVIVEGKPGYVVKRGAVSTTEAEIIKKLGDNGIGPKLLYAEQGRRLTPEYGRDMVKGRIAMSIVPGNEAIFFDKHSDKVGKTTVGDAFWYLRSQLHRLGIAHNDAHSKNVLIDDKGKARFIDLGLAHSNVKAALSEALGVFTARKFLPDGSTATGLSGDFQAKAPIYGVKGLLKGDAPANLIQMSQNLNNVYSLMRQAGLSNEDISKVIKERIRQTDNHYEKGVWSKISNDLATKLIDTLYEGVKDYS